MTHCFGVRRGGQRRLFCSVSLHDTLKWALLPALRCIKYQPTPLSVAVSVARVKAVRDTHLAQQQEKRGCCYYTTNMTQSEVTQDDILDGWEGATVVFLSSSLSRRVATSSHRLPPLSGSPPNHPKSATPGYFCPSRGNDCRRAYGCVINS